VHGFLDNAARILEAAENVSAAGETPSDYTILMGAEIGIHLVANSDWPLDSLMRERGARMAYRVSGSGNRVTVDACDENRTCHMESIPPAQVARMLLNALPSNYTFTQPALAA
jgi:hypothetical protein